MSSSRIFVTKRQPVFMGYICSCCHNPIVSVITAEAEAQKTYTVSRGKAQRIATETADEALGVEIRRLQRAQRNKSSLAINPNQDTKMLEIGLFCKSEICGTSTSCPLCRQRELWQLPSVSIDQLGQLDASHFPIVINSDNFCDPDTAGRWALDILAKYESDIEKLRQDPETVQKKTAETLQILSAIAGLKRQKESIPEQMQIHVLTQEKAELEKEKSELPFTNLKARRAMSDKIKILSLRMDDLQKTAEQKQREIDRKIVQEQIRLQATQAIAFGFTGQPSCLQSLNSYCYMVTPNPIPSTLLQQLQENDGQQAEETPAQQRYCRKCGFKLRPESQFCSNCGSAV